MAVVRVLSAGAAQAVVEKIADAFRRETGNEVRADFGAVGAMRARVTGGEAVDVIVLTRALIEELASGGYVTPGTGADLGTVGTGVAVRKGGALPDVASAQALRASLLAAGTVVCPDPAIATAGKVVMRMLERLDIAVQVKPRMQYFPNGYAAMKWLAASAEPRAIGITQITEILANNGVSHVGPLPAELQMKTVYTAGLAAQAPAPEAAREFISRLVAPAARPMLAEAGYKFED
ncbi:MAG: ABC transporter substrate-binding protein [Betaproteobacteria bacterium]|nr:ABC transporter substrate-binding protein [Betaproteobacteria bacterium]